MEATLVRGIPRSGVAEGGCLTPHFPEMISKRYRWLMSAFGRERSARDMTIER